MRSDVHSRRVFLKATGSSAFGAFLFCSNTNRTSAGSKPAIFAKHSDWDIMHDRVWIGPDYWANPMEDWRIKNGRLECTTTGNDRNVHILTHQLAERNGDFKLSIKTGLIEMGPNGSVGFRIGIHDAINDYRGNCFFGSGIDAVIQTNGQVMLAGRSKSFDRNIPYGAWSKLNLCLSAVQEGQQHRLDFKVSDRNDNVLAEFSAHVDSERLIGNLAIVNNHQQGGGGGARFWFQDWQISGSKVHVKKARSFGPILWAMHTLSNSRSAEGHVMKMTAQMPPMGEKDSKTVVLEAKGSDGWETLGRETIDSLACTATFRIARWPAERDVPYRLVYETPTTDGHTLRDEWAGTIRRDPVDRPLRVAGMTCQYATAFPYAPLERNLAALNPDVLYFSGDQIYEGNGGYGVIRDPADQATLNYLRKWYMFGWAFGDVMRSRPTICLPDDHDVFQGNLWGEGGVPMPLPRRPSFTVGYIQPLVMVNAVHRTQTSHHPDFFDPRPTEHGMSVFYGDMVYGRVSFAMVSDRQFKSGPHHIDTGSGRRPDHLTDPDIDPASLDKSGLTMLGERQKTFLKHWAADWRGADMKVLLSGTTFANAATHHGTIDNHLIADIDSGGWPQSARNRILEIARSARAFHISGDQHLATLIHQGIDAQRDAIWAFCTPAIAVGYQRWWRPDEMGFPYANRPDHGLENTGEYLDGLENKIFVYAVANPLGTGSGAPDRYMWAQIKASGFGFCVIDTTSQTIEVRCYKFLTDVTDLRTDHQYAGWPKTLQMRDNDGRNPSGYLPEVSIEGVDRAILMVYDERNSLVYAERIPGNTVRPWVYEKGIYTAKLGDPDTDTWEVIKDVEIS